MGERLDGVGEESLDAVVPDVSEQQTMGKMTVLEALAQDTEAVGVSRSNQSTRGPNLPDPDDQ